MNKKYLACMSCDNNMDSQEIKEDLETALLCTHSGLHLISFLAKDDKTNWDLRYGRGYFKALLDFRNAIEGWDKSLKSKKQYVRAIESYLKVLTEDSWIREKFMEYGGDPDWMEMGVIMTKDGEVKKFEE